MKIPVFVSCPTSLNKQQSSARQIILHELESVGLEPRAVGRSDYPTDLPLREVFLLAKRCAGGVILGFEQFRAPSGTWKRATPEEKTTRSPVPFPTSWNHLEAGILYSLGLPLLVFREDGITGGVFDPGVTDVFVHRMPAPRRKVGLSDVFLKWQASVRAQYYR